MRAGAMTLCCAGILLAAAGAKFEDDTCGSSCARHELGIFVPQLESPFSFHGGILFLKPSSENLGYAVLTTEKNYASPVPLATPLWNVESLSPSLQPGFEFGGGYSFVDTGRDLQLNWQHLRADAADAAAAGDGQWISPFSQTGPPTAADYDDIETKDGVNKLRSATGDGYFHYDSVTLDFGQYVDVGQSLRLRWFGGLAFARLQQRIVSNFYGAPPAPDAPFPASTPIWIQLDNESTFWGVGPRLGVNPVYQTPRGLRFTGQLAGALLIGQTQPAQYEFAATAPELAAVGIAVNREYISSSSFTQVVYAVDAKLGLGYTHVLPNRAIFTIDAGYMAAIYINPFQGYETNNNVLALQIGSLSSASVRQTQSNFTLNGPYLTAGLQW